MIALLLCCISAGFLENCTAHKLPDSLRALCPQAASESARNITALQKIMIDRSQRTETSSLLAYLSMLTLKRGRSTEQIRGEEFNQPLQANVRHSLNASTLSLKYACAQGFGRTLQQQYPSQILYLFMYPGEQDLGSHLAQGLRRGP